MDTFILLLFAGILMFFVIMDLPIVMALVIGYCIFFLYGRKNGHSSQALFKMSMKGVKKVTNILILFFLIGLMTASWRAAGTIPAIIYYSAELIQPSVMVLMTFLLNSVVSFLTGTSFGTAATMGVICMTMASTMNIPPAIIGGAVLSGAFYGDRCSPVSSSTHLVAAITKTDAFDNIRLMFRTALLPFLSACIFYVIVGSFFGGSGYSSEGTLKIFSEHFNLGFLPLIPALLMMALSLLKVNMKITMGTSIISAFLIAYFYQGAPAPWLLQSALSGCRFDNPALADMINGGGILSMVNVGFVVCISSSYSGLFEGIGILDGIRARLLTLREKTGFYPSMLIMTAFTAMVTCNQSLVIILAQQLFDTKDTDPSEMAINLEDTAVIMAPMIPWSIACAVPLATIGAPSSSVLFAAYLYLIPVFRLIMARHFNGSLKKLKHA